MYNANHRPHYHNPSSNTGAGQIPEIPKYFKKPVLLFRKGELTAEFDSIEEMKKEAQDGDYIIITGFLENQTHLNKPDTYLRYYVFPSTRITFSGNITKPKAGLIAVYGGGRFTSPGLLDLGSVSRGFHFDYLAFTGSGRLQNSVTDFNQTIKGKLMIKDGDSRGEIIKLTAGIISSTLIEIDRIFHRSTSRSDVSVNILGAKGNEPYVTFRNCNFDLIGNITHWHDESITEGVKAKYENCKIKCNYLQFGTYSTSLRRVFPYSGDSITIFEQSQILSTNKDRATITKHPRVNSASLGEIYLSGHSKIISAHPEFAMEDDFKLLVEGELWTNRKVNKVNQITEGRIIIDENIRFWSFYL